MEETQKTVNEAGSARQRKCAHDGGCDSVLIDETESTHYDEHRDACDDSLRGEDWWCENCHGNSSDKSSRGYALLDKWADEQSERDAQEVVWLDDETAAREYATLNPQTTVCRSTNNTDQRGRWTYYAHGDRGCDPCAIAAHADAGDKYSGQIQVLHAGDWREARGQTWQQ